MKSTTALRVAAIAYVLAAVPAFGQQAARFSEQDFGVALGFFRDGGAWAVRIIPPADADKEETWTVLILRAKGSNQTSFTLGGIELSPTTQIAAASKVGDLYDAPPGTLVEFLRRYAAGIDEGMFEALMVSVAPLKDGERVPMNAAAKLTTKGLLDLIK